ncbi:hypothetical protein [Candidatus Neptunichlamydia sp. REUL1]|uniref:hypothetical protein n=1 Tax=Candidatus Neptunichlamydia sp. REUL1 TaxID=3064277 RepID=UPI00292EED0A|nr:hypothetical protein [Candidatus Neptunochlamydia sp. REUL1]
MSKWTEFSISKHLQTTKTIKKHLFFRTQKFYILKLLNLFGSKQPHYQKITSIAMVEDSASGEKHWKNRAIGDLLTKADKNDVIVVSTITATVLGLAAQIEREFISVRTKEALAKRKSDGVQLGRPKGPAASLKLDEREEEIVGYLKKSISKRAIAKLTDCSPSTLYKWMKRRKIEKKVLQPA